MDFLRYERGIVAQSAVTSDNPTEIFRLQGAVRMLDTIMAKLSRKPHTEE